MAASECEFYSTRGFSEKFALVNRNEPSVALNLKYTDDVAQLEPLVAVAHIVVESYQCNVLPELRLG